MGSPARFYLSFGLLDVKWAEVVARIQYTVVFDHVTVNFRLSLSISYVDPVVSSSSVIPLSGLSFISQTDERVFDSGSHAVLKLTIRVSNQVKRISCLTLAMNIL